MSSNSTKKRVRNLTGVEQVPAMFKPKKPVRELSVTPTLPEPQPEEHFWECLQDCQGFDGLFYKQGQIIKAEKPPRPSPKLFVEVPASRVVPAEKPEPMPQWLIDLHDGNTDAPPSNGVAWATGYAPRGRRR